MRGEQIGTAEGIAIATIAQGFRGDQMRPRQMVFDP
jgi:hypothetical protein